MLNTNCDNLNIAIYKPEEHPLGKTWEEWTCKWWQWFLSIPREKNPALDSNGKNCDINQNDFNVWFLAGTLGGQAERTIVIRQGKAVLFPVISFATSYAENPTLMTEKEMILDAKSNIDDIAKTEVSINGVSLQHPQFNRVASPPFDIVLPHDNVCGAEAGLTRAAGDGYWVFLKPVSIGKYEIKIAGSCLSGKIQIGANINLIVQA